jgi:hypothetical protein
MNEQETLTKIVELESELASVKSTLRQAVDAIKGTVKNDIQESERRVTDFLGDRLTDVTNKAQNNSGEILNLKVALWGDKDRNIGLINEQTDLERNVESLMKMKEQWDGTGTEDNPGIPVQVTRLTLKERDRNSRTQFLAGVLSLGGLTIFGIVSSVGWSLIQRGLDASANRAQNIENRLTVLSDVDKGFAVAAEGFRKDIEWIKKSIK